MLVLVSMIIIILRTQTRKLAQSMLVSQSFWRLNMEVECFKVTLKPDSLPTVREWAARMKSDITEVEALLKNEGITLESVFLDESENGASLIYYLRSPDLKKARETSRASKHPLDLYHQQVMKLIANSGKQLECLFDASGV
jgi:hypothetical protein